MLTVADRKNHSKVAKHYLSKEKYLEKKQSHKIFRPGAILQYPET